MSLPDHISARMRAATDELEARLAAENRIAIGDARWEPDNAGNYHLVVDSVPVNTVKILGKDEVLRLYRVAKGEISGLETP